MNNDYQVPLVTEVGSAKGLIQGYKFFFFCVIDSELWIDFANRVMDIDEADE
jgi:hypothetical protein